MIITIARALNEEDNVARFCREYTKISDMVVIADGGSTDRTKEIASEFNRVKVIDFLTKRQIDGGRWFNPENEHVNYLIEIAEGMGAEWILFDDMDSVPNKYAKEHFPDTIAEAESLMRNFIHSRRAYIWGSNQWFPDMTMAGFPLWGWRANIHFRFNEKSVLLETGPIPVDEQLRLEIPHVLLHYFAPSEEKVQQKAEFYRETGIQPTYTHPLEYGGRLADLPEWGVL